MDFREHWVPVKEDPDYEVSNLGNVRNRRNGRLLSQSLNDENGYYRVYLHRKKYYVHRLVYHAFFDCEIDGYEINHIDGNKKNNHIANLERCTHEDNMKHAVRTGLYRQKGRRYPMRIVYCRDCMHKDECHIYTPLKPRFYCADGQLERDI